ncbi:MAG: PQQ-binding-like beta-propeller repeat protein, partial [Bacteroidota bacterium]
WVYERMPINEAATDGVLFHKPVIHDQKIYAIVGNTVYCHDLANGQPIWSQEINGNLSVSGILIYQNRLVVNGGDDALVALDVQNGQVLWRGEGSGTSSFLPGRELNGVLYFSGGGSGKIHAVDLETGQTIWRLEAGMVEPEADDWKPDVYVVAGKNGEKGRIVAMTHQHAYCFPAAR